MQHGHVVNRLVERRVVQCELSSHHRGTKRQDAQARVLLTALSSQSVASSCSGWTRSSFSGRKCRGFMVFVLSRVNDVTSPFGGGYRHCSVAGPSWVGTGSCSISLGAMANICSAVTYRSDCTGTTLIFSTRNVASMVLRTTKGSSFASRYM